MDVAVDAAGDVYIADYEDDLVEKVTPSGTLSVFAGTGKYGPPTPGPATSSDLDGPEGVAVDAAGDVYIADEDNYVIEKVTPGGSLSIVAGTGSSGPPTSGPATSSELDRPYAVAVDPTGDLFIDDEDNDVIEKVTPGGTLSIFAGTGSQTAAVAGPATSSGMGDVRGVVTDAAGDLYIADDYNSEIEKVTPSGTLSIIAGNGGWGPETPGPALSSMLANPTGMAIDPAGDLYVSGSDSNVIDEITPSGTLSIIAGTGTPGAPTAGPPLSSDLNQPSGVAMNPAGDAYYIADYANGVVEKVALPAPVASTLPSISGTPTVGTTLLASPGSWSNDPTGYGYQWQVCDAGGANCTDVSGATFSSYTVTAADAGRTLRVVVSAQNGGGSMSADSAATAVVLSPAPSPAPSPTPTGDGVGLSTHALRAGLSVSAGGGLQLPLVCPQTASGCDADGTLTLALSNSHALFDTAITPINDSVLARFTGVEIETGHSRLVSVKLTPAATRYLQTRGIHRVRVTLTINNHLSGGSDVTTRQLVWLNIAALRASCPAAIGTLTASSLAQMRLGLTRSQAHHLGRHRKAGHGFERYCLTGGAIRVTYPAATLDHHLTSGERRAVAGRVIVALTDNVQYTIHGVRVRMSVRAARTRLDLGRGIVVGKNTWYIVQDHRATWILKVQHGVIHEIGITQRPLANTRAQQTYLVHHL
jgi:hypothetical protein